MDINQLKFPIRSDKLSMNVHVSAELESIQTDFQKIQIVETEAFGRVLLLDGHIQLTELDEHAYHEALVQVPALSVPSLETALVIGGGDGGVIRELCKHPALDRVDMVEIDEGVVQTCRNHLPFVSNGAFDDQRVHLHVADAFEFVKNSQELYDLIVVDCTDVYEEEDGALSEMLFTEQFYRDISDRLSPTGFVVTQADNLLFCPYSLDHLLKLYGSIFDRTGSYFAVVPSFGGFSGFCWGSHGAGLLPEMRHSDLGLRYLNPITYAYGMTGRPIN